MVAVGVQPIIVLLSTTRFLKCVLCNADHWSNDGAGRPHRARAHNPKLINSISVCRWRTRVQTPKLFDNFLLGRDAMFRSECSAGSAQSRLCDEFAPWQPCGRSLSSRRTPFSQS